MLDMLHDLIQAKPLKDELPGVLECRIETVALDLWMHYQATGENPQVCQDPFCQCHEILRDFVPLSFPGLPPVVVYPPDYVGPRE